MCTYTWLFTILFLFIAITFLQSGIDKVLNFSGNKSWLESVFKDTFLASLMPILFPLLVFQELAVGSKHTRHVCTYRGLGVSAMPSMGWSIVFTIICRTAYSQRLCRSYGHSSLSYSYGTRAIFYSRIISC
jgi:uncharacterized membrane protein YphA (DoxX/SURF4 family)